MYMTFDSSRQFGPGGCGVASRAEERACWNALIDEITSYNQPACKIIRKIMMKDESFESEGSVNVS